MNAHSYDEPVSTSSECALRPTNCDTTSRQLWVQSLWQALSKAPGHIHRRQRRTTLMNTIRWLLAKIFLLFFASKAQQMINKLIIQKESGDYADSASENIRTFDEDYGSATYMLKLRMNKKFPDNYHTRLSSGENSPYDHGGGSRAGRRCCIDRDSDGASERSFGKTGGGSRRSECGYLGLLTAPRP